MHFHFGAGGATNVRSVRCLSMLSEALSSFMVPATLVPLVCETVWALALSGGFKLSLLVVSSRQFLPVAKGCGLMTKGAPQSLIDDVRMEYQAWPVHFLV